MWGSGGGVRTTHLPHDVGLTARLAELLQAAGLARRSRAAGRLASRVADGQEVVLEVHGQLSQALFRQTPKKRKVS